MSEQESGGVTPEMVRAGLAAYEAWFNADDVSVEDLVRTVFLRMKKAAASEANRQGQ